MDASPLNPRGPSVEQSASTAESRQISAVQRSDGILVLAVVVARGEAPELEAVLAGLVAQDHRRLEVVVVSVPDQERDRIEGGDTPPISARVAALLPNSVVLEAPSGIGHGASVAAALAAQHPIPENQFLLLVPGGVVLGDTAVRRLVERAMEVNAAVVGPKVFGPDGDLVETGWRLDRLCSPVPIVVDPEPDQGQHDADLVPLAVAGSAWMVRSDLYADLGGLDPEVDEIDGSLEFCLRARRAGATVAVVPSAVARRLKGIDQDEAKRSRLRLRLMLTGHSRAVSVLGPLLLAASLIGVVYGLAVGRFRHAWGLLAAWPWNFRRLASARRLWHRSMAAATNRVAEPVVVPHHALRRVVTGRDLPADKEGWAAHRRLNGVFNAAFGPGGLVLLAAAVVIGFGSRTLLTEGPAAVGRLRGLYTDPSELVTSWWSGWRTGGTGTGLIGPDGLAVLGFSAGIWPGSFSSLWTLVVVGSVAAGALGVWRLVRPVGGGRSRAVAVLVYLSAPLPYEALREGGLATLTAYAVLPWVVRRFVGAQGMAPYGSRGGDPGPGARVRDLWPDVVVTGVALASVVAIEPVLVVPISVILIGLVVGTLLAGRMDGLGRLTLVVAGGAVLAAVVHLPFAVDLLEGRDATSLGAGIRPMGEGIGILDVLGLDVGADGRTAASALFVMPALALFATSGRHLAVVVRAWSIVATAAGLLVARDLGWFGGIDGLLAVVEPEVLLVVVSLGLAWASAAGAANLGEALMRASSIVGKGRLGQLCRSTILGLVVLALGVGAAPVMARSFDGSWGAPQVDLVASLPEIGPRSADGDQRIGGDARILWLGDPRILPAVGLPLESRVRQTVPGASGLALAVTDGRPDLADQWATGSTTGLLEIREAVLRAMEGDLHRLGAEVGRWGVARVVLVERSAPIPEPGLERPLSTQVIGAFARQMDLERVQAVNGAATVYRNTAVEAPYSVVRDGNRRLVPASVGRIDLGHRTLGIPADGALRWMHGPDDRWVLSADGRDLPVLGSGSPSGVDGRPSVRVAAGTEVVFTLDDDSHQGQRRFQIVAAFALLLLASWARTGRRARTGVQR